MGMTARREFMNRFAGFSLGQLTCTREFQSPSVLFGEPNTKMPRGKQLGQCIVSEAWHLPGPEENMLG